MVGLLLADDAVEARKNSFQEWIDQQKKTAEQVTSTVAQPLVDEVAQRRQQFDDWVSNQNAAQPGAQPATPAPAPAPEPVPAEQPPPSAPAAVAPPAAPDEIQQRQSAFQDWIDQQNQQQPPATALAPAAVPGPGPSPASSPIGRADQGPISNADYVFPVQGYHGAVQDHWGEVLGGSDLFAERGTPVVAMRGGKVLEAGFNPVGGNAVLVQGDDGNQYYYAHFDANPAVHVGDVVHAGTYLGPVGDTGDARGKGTHLHIGIGPDIKLGADKYGGTGGDYDAVSLLRRTLDNTATTTAPPDRTDTMGQVGPGTGGLTDRAKGILSGAADAARAFGDDAARAVQAVLVTEHGMDNARGDNGRSAGPLQFFEGGQLANLASQLGITLDAAKQWAEDNPLAAVRWALGTPDQPGYLGRAIIDGQRAGSSGSDLATYIQANGQVSEAPERAGQNYDALFGAGRDLVGLGQRGLNDLTQQGSDIANRAGALASSSADLVRSSGAAAQNALDQLNQTRTGIATQAQQYLDQRTADLDRRRQDLLSSPRPSLDMGPNQAVDQGQPSGFLAPITSSLDQARSALAHGDISTALDAINQTQDRITSGFTAPTLNAAGQGISDAITNLPDTISRGLDTSGRARQIEENRQRAVAEDLVSGGDQGLTGALGSGLLRGSEESQVEQQADVRSGDALATTIIDKAKAVGWNPTPDQERVAHEALAQITPMNVLMTAVSAPLTGEASAVRLLAESAAALALPAAGATAGAELAPNLPEGIRPYAPLLGGLAAPVVGPLAARGAIAGVRGALERPEIGAFLRDEAGSVPAPRGDLGEDPAALQRRMAQVSFTASPGSAEMQRVPGYMEAPEHERAAYNAASESGFLEPITKRDQLAEGMGVQRGRTIEAPEVYGDYVGPGLQAEVPVPAAKVSLTEKVFDAQGNPVIDPQSGRQKLRTVPIPEARGAVAAPARAALNGYAAGRGIILKQDAVPWTRVFYTDAPLRDSNVVELYIGRPLTSGEATDINAALTRSLGPGNHAVVSTPDGAWILNLQGTFERNPNAPKKVIEYTRSLPMEGPLTEGQTRRPNIKLPATREEDIRGTWIPYSDAAGNPLPNARNEDFIRSVNAALGPVQIAGDPEVHLTPHRGDGEYVSNDWSANPNGEDYRSLIESAGRTQDFATLEAAITRRVRKAQADTAARFGWPADPTNPFSRAEQPGATGERGLPGAAGAEPAPGVGPRAPPEGAGFTAPTTELPTTAGADIRQRLRDLATGAGSEAGGMDLATGMRLGGAVAGGLAGNATTPQDADPFTRAAHIGAGAAAGAFGPRLALNLARGAAGPTARELEQLAPRALAQGPIARESGLQRLVTFGKENLLTGPTTHISNIISQSVELARQPAVRAMMGREDEAAAGIRAAAAMIPTAISRFADAFTSGRSVYSPEPRYTPRYHPALRLLGATDEFFRTIGEGMGRGMEARRVLNEAGSPTDAATIRQAIQNNVGRITQSGERTSRLTVFGEGQGTGIGQWFSDQKQRLMRSNNPRDRALGLGLDAIVPFSGVPDRIWTAGIGRTPGAAELGGLARFGWNVARGDRVGAQQALSEAAVSSVIGTMVLSQVANGNVTGPDDPEHPHSVRINGNWVDYSNWGPYALPFAIPASLYESIQKTGNKPDAQTMDYINNASVAVSKTMLQQNFLASFLRVMTQVGQGQLGAAAAGLGESYAERYVPEAGLLNQWEQAFDDNVRDINPSHPWERIQSRIPGLAGMLPEKVSQTTGQPDIRQRAGVLGTLFRTETTESDPVKAELNKLDRAGYSLSAPTDYPDTVSWHGAEIKLRPDEQRAIARELGQMRAALADTMSSPSWQSEPPNVKARWLDQRMNQIADRKTAVWLSIVDPADAQRRQASSQRVVGKLQPAAPVPEITTLPDRVAAAGR